MKHLQKYLNQRREKNALRYLSTDSALIDFCSNDYLGFGRNKELAAILENKRSEYELPPGSTGSRLISGNSQLAEDVENYLASFYGAEAALIFQSGYDANIGFWSSVPQRGDTVVYDEYIHASIRDGIRLGPANGWSFHHNDLDDLRARIRRAKGRVYVAVESVYSMDGDEADLKELANICRLENVHLFVDEAHSAGVIGQGRGSVVELGLMNDTDARLVTFGKAFGLHGAVILGSKTLKEYLVNFARSFIYTTGPSPETFLAIKTVHEYRSMIEYKNLYPSDKIDLFKSLVKGIEGVLVIPSNTPIQSVLIAGNDRVKKVSEHLRSMGFDVRPILHPTVPEGKERLRIVIHTFNSEEEIRNLCAAINEAV